jgi:hypothetical protein
MPSPFDDTLDSDADRYGFVIMALNSSIEDAQAIGCDPEGIRLLNEARDRLWADFNRRFPGFWEQPATLG